MRKRAPPAGLSSTRSRPPWRRQCSAAIASPSPVPGRGRRSAGVAAVETFEDELPLGRSDAGPASSTAISSASTVPETQHAGCAVRVVVGVVEEIREDPVDAAMIESCGLRCGRVDDDRDLGVSVSPQHVLDERGGIRRFQGECRRARVESRDLEQVEDEAFEAIRLPAKDLERGPGVVVDAALEHVDRGSDRGQRRAQLVTDVRREPRLAVDAFLECVDHVVEGVDERREIGIVCR